MKAKYMDRFLSQKWSRELICLFFLALPFILMDVFIRLLSSEINYSTPLMIIPTILFSFAWIFLIVILSRNLKGNLGRIFYAVIFFVFFILFATHLVYFPLTDFFFGFHLLESADEGSAYIWSSLKNISPINLIKLVFIFIIGVIAIIKFPKRNTYNWKKIIITVLSFGLLHFITPALLGRASDSLQWDNWRNPRNVYNNFSDLNKNIKICGFYEYSIRDFYVNFIKPDKSNEKNPEEDYFLKSAYTEPILHEKNEYTGIFEGKNLIFLQLEGIDDWLLTPEIMPNLYSLTENSIVFDDHYSYYNGGGSTFNSEFAVCTGYITPISFIENAYSFHSNLFPYSMPHMFKTRGYSVNAFHMNSGEYYSRNINYKNWGFDNYFSLLDDASYKDKSYQLDRELILNENFYNKMFCQSQPFVNYIITYTVHTPFDLNSDVGRELTSRLYPDTPIPELNEEETAKLFAAETDHMISLLIQALKDNGLYDNTVIVAYADHYLYTLNDKSILEQYKETKNNLINHTPFFIWSSNLQKTNVNKANSQLDILPTVLNLFGFEYDENHYIGRDVLSASSTGYVFFNDYSWYDGNLYVTQDGIPEEHQIYSEYISEINTMIYDLIRKNDLTLKYNYFKEITKNVNNNDMHLKS